MPGDSAKQRRLAVWGQKLRRMLRRHIGDIKKSERPWANVRDAVIITSSTRRQYVNGLWQHTIADPLAEWLSCMDLSSLVWEIGGELYPRAKPSAWIDAYLIPLLGRNIRRLRRHEASATPDWFQYVAAWSAELLERDICWEDLLHAFQTVTAMSSIFERWLRRTQCKYLFLDCWYNWPSMAATMAAKRLGVRTIEIQHGRIGITHPAYAQWRQKPHQGYEVHPDIFWAWGSADVTSVVCEEQPSRQTVIGGNLWLNHWREGRDQSFRPEIHDAQKLVAGYERSVLVTLQPALGTEHLQAVIQHSPRSWRWLVRLHPRMHECLPKIAKALAETGHPGVDVESSTRAPLYALLLSADVHLTGFSTSALEALAFGKPTVLTSSLGESAFSEHIDRGVMIGAQDTRSVIRAIEKAATIDEAACLEESEQTFAPTLTPSNATLDLFVIHDGIRDQFDSNRLLRVVS